MQVIILLHCGNFHHRGESLAFLFSCCCSLTNRSRAGGCAGFNYPFLTLKERDNETGLDYFGARYYASIQGRFTGADNIVYAKAVDPQTWNQYTYCRNGPLSRIDVDGHNWFLVHHKKGGDAWEWQEGSKYTVPDTGKKLTSKYTNLIVVSLTTSTSYSGANYGTVALYGKGFNDVKARDTYAFAGGYGAGNEPPGAGEYFINLAKVGKVNEAWAVRDGRLANFHGFQYIPERTAQGTEPQLSWGHMRANLSRAAWVDGEPVFREGNSTSRYLHGHENSRGLFGTDGTLGCVATPDEHVLNYLSHSIGNPQVHPQIPVSVKAPQ
jgi:RHS repeat-associated protein